ncbi:MAG: PIN domain-containing protein [Patescibacteria group bacterium]
MIFIDTSALYALADTKDNDHARAKDIFEHLLRSGEDLLTHNYCIVETSALIQHRLGFVLAQAFLQDVSLFSVVWIDGRMHDNTVLLFTSLKKRKVSFVDCTSFVVMKARGVQRVFAFDEDFAKQGFVLVGDK